MITFGIGDMLSGLAAKVTKESALLVSDIGIPPVDDELRIKPYRKFLTLNGDGITKSMLIDGSITPQRFYIESTTNDIYITSLSFVIVDAAASLNQFGNIAALTVGCSISWETISETITLADSLRTNWDFIRYCGGNPTIGQGANSFRANNVLGSSEGYTPFKDLIQQSPPYGIKLRANSTEKLVLIVNDNTSAIDQFDVIAEGFERILS